MKLIIANFKANKNYNDILFWLNTFLKNDFSPIKNKVEIIICPPNPFLITFKEKTKLYSLIKIGAQDLSVFEEGPYTGEVTAKILYHLIDYVIIGHSERRKYFKEKEETLFKKFYMAKKYQINPLFCVRNEFDSFPKETEFLVYEPEKSISNGSGYGKNESLENILTTKNKLIINRLQKFIYGGSVNEQNANLYLKNELIDGIMIGGASLEPNRFFQIIKNLDN